MSFILEALRKSEHERERRALPGLADLPVSRSMPSKLPLVLAGLGALLIINVAVLSIVLLKPVAPARPTAGLAAESVAPAAAPRAVAPPDAPQRTTAPDPTATASSGRTRPLDAEAGGAEDAADYPEPAPA